MLVKCKSCGKEVSANAKTCPHCGEPNPHELGKTGCLVFFVMVIIISMAISFCSDNSGGIYDKGKTHSFSLIKQEDVSLNNRTRIKVYIKSDAETAEDMANTVSKAASVYAEKYNAVVTTAILECKNDPAYTCAFADLITDKKGSDGETDSYKWHVETTDSPDGGSLQTIYEK